MKFGETFSEYLHGDQEQLLEKCSNIEYKRLKKVLKSCRICRAMQGFSSDELHEEKNSGSSQLCQCESCPLCDQKFFAELTKEASEIAGCFSSRVKRLIHLHDSPGLRRYMRCLRPCFTNNQQDMVQEGRMLIDYVTMNAIAIQKILKKYDKIHRSVSGRNFKTKLRAEHIELLQSPWLIELGAFYINFSRSAIGGPNEFFQQFTCDLHDAQPVMTLTLSDSVKLEFSLTCAVCLGTLFNPYALVCGHLFCKGCACSAASVLHFEGLKAAPPEAKCPICRAVGVYADAVHMTELALLLKNSRCHDYWKERKDGERSEMLKQSKEYWQLQTMYALGY